MNRESGRPTICSGHGLGAELRLSFVTRAEWGYRSWTGRGDPRAERHVRRAVTDCPALALKLCRVLRGNQQEREYP